MESRNSRPRRASLLPRPQRRPLGASPNSSFLIGAAGASFSPFVPLCLCAFVPSRLGEIPLSPLRRAFKVSRGIG